MSLQDAVTFCSMYPASARLHIFSSGGVSKKAVLAATFDGASVNRSLAKLYDPQRNVKTFTHQTKKISFFISVPPHLKYKELLVIENL